MIAISLRSSPVTAVALSPLVLLAGCNPRVKPYVTAQVCCESTEDCVPGTPCGSWCPDGTCEIGDGSGLGVECDDPENNDSCYCTDDAGGKMADSECRGDAMAVLKCIQPVAL